MDDRLLKCFRAVFPQASDDALRGASVENTRDWDSVAAITLVNVIEEEFGVQLDYEVLPELSSFEAVRNHLQSLQV